MILKYWTSLVYLESVLTVVCHSFYILLDLICYFLEDFFMYIYDVFVWFGDYGNVGLIEWVKKCSLCFCFFEEIIENWCHLLFQCLMEFTSETVWASCFLFWRLYIFDLIFFVDADQFRLFVGSLGIFLSSYSL